MVKVLDSCRNVRVTGHVATAYGILKQGAQFRRNIQINRERRKKSIQEGSWEFPLNEPWPVARAHQATRA